MSARYHRIPKSLFDALAAGGGGPDAVRALAAARHSKLVVLLWGVLEAAQGAGAEQARLARQAYDLLAEVQRRDPEVADETIRHPSVGAWALRTVRMSRTNPADPGAKPGRLSTVAAAAAIRAGLTAEIEVTAADGTVMLPLLGAALVDGGTAVVRSNGTQAEVSSAGRRVKVPADPHRDAPGWLGLRKVRLGAFNVLIDDLDPFRMPSSPDLAPRLTTADANKLVAALGQAWPLLEAHHPEIAAEIAAAVTVIVPLTNKRGGQVSSSSSATFGAIALSVPPDPYTCAETLAHEIQHLKLCALLDLVNLTLPDDGQRFYAPWRADPRPIGGLLQGAYAFLGVSGFWRRQRRLAEGSLLLRAETEFARWRAAAAGVVRTLRSSGRLTPAGLDFVQGMARTLDAWQAEPVGAEALALAHREAEVHLARWQSDNGPLPAP
jgi:uncharacterized protein